MSEMPNVLVIPGDGIGPEVTEASMIILKKVMGVYNINMNIKVSEAGDEAARRYGDPLPLETRKLALKWADAILKGPVGESAGEVVVPLRRMIDAYANIRPSKTLKRQKCKPYIDLVIVRENLEDVYSGIEFTVGDSSFALKVVTRAETRRVARIAAKYARDRNGKVTVVHKANVLKKTDGLFRDESLSILNGEGISVDEMYVDAAAMELVRNPSRFDVILTMNQYGDILSDLAAEVSGSIGLSPSANIGDSKALFEPVHGTAWDIAGEGKANPTAMILAASMMLQWLGYQEASRAVFNAVEVAYERGYGTPDVGGRDSTIEFASRIANFI